MDCTLLRPHQLLLGKVLLGRIDVSVDKPRAIPDGAAVTIERKKTTEQKGSKYTFENTLDHESDHLVGSRSVQHFQGRNFSLTYFGTST